MGYSLKIKKNEGHGLIKIKQGNCDVNRIIISGFLCRPFLLEEIVLQSIQLQGWLSKPV